MHGTCKIWEGGAIDIVEQAARWGRGEEGILFLAIISGQGPKGEALLWTVPGASPIAWDEEREIETPPRGLRGDLARMRMLQA